MAKRDYSIQKPTRCKSCHGLLKDDAVYDGNDRLHAFCAYVVIRKRAEQTAEENTKLKAELEQLRAKLNELVPPPKPPAPEPRPAEPRSAEPRTAERRPGRRMSN